MTPPGQSEDDLRAMYAHSLDVLRECVRGDNAALVRLTRSPPRQAGMQYAALARMAAAALQAATDEPLNAIDVVRRNISEGTD